MYKKYKKNKSLLRSQDAADKNGLLTRDGLQMDSWTSHWDQTMKYSRSHNREHESKYPKAAVSVVHLLGYPSLQTSVLGAEMCRPALAPRCFT